MQENKLKAQLAMKLLAITEDLGNLENDGHNKFSNYKYPTYEQLNSKLQTLLVKHKILIVPSFIEVTEKTIASSKGHEGIRSLLKAEIEIIDAETGYSITKYAYGADNDTTGKSLGLAHTELMKRFEFKLFHTSSHGESDPDSKSTNGSFKQNNSLKTKHHSRLAKDLGITLNELEKISQKEFKTTCTNLNKQQLLIIHAKYRKNDEETTPNDEYDKLIEGENNG